MSIQKPITTTTPGGGLPQKIFNEKGFMVGYLEALSLVERLHRLLLDVIKDEFELQHRSAVELINRGQKGCRPPREQRPLFVVWIVAVQAGHFDTKIK